MIWRSQCHKKTCKGQSVAKNKNGQQHKRGKHDRQTDTTTVLNLVISQKLRVARFTTVLSYDLHEIQLTQKEALLDQKYLAGSIAYPNHNLKTYGGPEAFTSTTIILKYRGKLVQDGRNATSWKSIGSFNLRKGKTMKR